MRPSVLFPLFADVATLDNVGPKTREALERLGCNRVIDLLWHLPSSSIHRPRVASPAFARDGDIITISIKIDTHFPPPQGLKHSRRHPYRIRCATDCGFLTLVFFNSYSQYIIEKLRPESLHVVSGKIERFNNELQMVHPDYCVHPDKVATIPEYEPVYPLTYALASRQLARIIHSALPRCPDFQEWLPEEIVRKQQWKPWKQAVAAAHDPSSPDHARSRKRLAFDELLANQLALSLTRRFVHKLPGCSMKGHGKLRKLALQNMGFALTSWQETAVQDIVHDQAAETRMMRLLQGDVGSGKTAVALLAMLNVVESGKQAALMAPTEILAQQHFKWMSRVVEGTGVNIAFLSGSTRSKERQETLRELVAGTIDIIIGTHALFQDDVVFHALGLGVIDEQHRFGVEQRMRLAAKSNYVDILLMTATPIPRTLTLTAYGDMDISYLRGKPAGRLAIATRIVPLSRLDEIVASLRRALEAGTKAYWICPLIEEPEDKEAKEHAKADLAAAEARFLEFQSLFEGKVGLVHGRMKQAEKDAAMYQFANGELQLLVATTVIEVGIDVPDATIMVIEHAERFGLSQLHQLRGRVGRGDKPSSCLLLYASPLGEISKARLQIMRESEDGFRIAEEDLRLRGGGEVLGTRQSGLPSFKMANLDEDSELLMLAREEVEHIMSTDPDLTSDQGQALKNLLYVFDYDTQMKYVRSG